MLGGGGLAEWHGFAELLKLVRSCKDARRGDLGGGTSPVAASTCLTCSGLVPATWMDREASELEKLGRVRF